MPFDNTPLIETDKHLVYKRLCILRELLPRSGLQHTYNTCLWSEARVDARLWALGVSDAGEPKKCDYSLFGGIADKLFGSDSKREKEMMLNRKIEELQVELGTV